MFLAFALSVSRALSVYHVTRTHVSSAKTAMWFTHKYKKHSTASLVLESKSNEVCRLVYKIYLTLPLLYLLVVSNG